MKSQRAAGPKKNESPGHEGLSPVEALQALRRVDEDRALTPAQARAVTAVILAARRSTGVARIGLREIQRRTGGGFNTILAALAAAKGRHLEPTGDGWRVLPEEKALSRRERYQGESAIKTRARALPRRKRGRYQGGSATNNTTTDAHRGERKKGAAPAPSAARGRKKEARPATLGARLKALAVRPCPETEWDAVVQEDIRHGRIRRPDLEAYLAGVSAIVCWPRNLAADVRVFAEAAKQAAFRERLRTIRAEGLVRAEGPDGEARVVYVEPERPLLVIERRTPPPRGTSYGPQTKRWDVTTPEALAAWRFLSDQPVLPGMEGGA